MTNLQSEKTSEKKLRNRKKTNGTVKTRANRKKTQKKTESTPRKDRRSKSAPATSGSPAPADIPVASKDREPVNASNPSDFSAGIFDTEASRALGEATAGRSSRARRKEQISENKPPKSRSSAMRSEDQSASEGESQQTESKSVRKRKIRKSRTRRLAEEAEVIASVASPPQSNRTADIRKSRKKTSEIAKEIDVEGEPDAGDIKPSDGANIESTQREASTRRKSKKPLAKKRSKKSRTKRAASKASEQDHRETIDPIDFDEVEKKESAAEGDGESSEDKEQRKKTREKTLPSKVVAASAQAVAREMLINVAEAEECRITILQDGRIDELYVERTDSSSNVGNIYKGRVSKVESSIQAAFVDFGLPFQGFLHISDLHPQYFPDSKGEPEMVGKKTPRRQRPPIQSCLERGQEVIVQVIKEGIGTKGPTLSSYISIPGRFLVMMPGMEQLGVSRKIEDDAKRRKMRDLLGQLSLPSGMGFIMRTAGVDRTKRDLQRDLNFLSRLWKRVALRIKKEPAPSELYRESDLVIRTIRDVYDTNLKRIVVDSAEVANRVREFLAIASPRAQDVVEVFDSPEPIFHHHGIETEINQLHKKKVDLPCGGSLVIEQTEALVAIDVNSGTFRLPENAEETAYRVNLEAVDEIARQLRLRDLGGLIVCDLIDMTQDRHRRTIERRFADALKQHKERAKILRISRFGLLEMTRQRQRASLTKTVFRECSRCAGSGRVKAAESVALDVMRQIRLASQREGVVRIDVRVSNQVASVLLNRKRRQLADLERACGQTIQINGTETYAVADVDLSCTDRRGSEVRAVEPVHRKKRSPARSTQKRGRRRGR